MVQTLRDRPGVHPGRRAGSADGTGEGMQFRVLGPIEVIDDDGRSIDVGGAQSRSVLAMLLVADDRIVPVETILDRLWPERQPSSAASTLQSYVSRLRRALRTPATEQVRLAFESGGYRLTVPV